ncbi:RING finger protein [Yarrowia sp. C11]|nr:RING finger protein [Yarrowia sp. C11]
MYTLQLDFDGGSSFSDWRVSSLSISGFDNDTGKSMDVVKGEYFGKGVVRLFRGVSQDKSVSSSDVELVSPVPSLIVAILAVPSYMTASDFLGFISLHSCEKDISHIRVIKSSRETNRNMVLLKFRMVERAQDFVDKYSGKVFNSMDPETCLCVFIHDISVGGEVSHTSGTNVVGADNFPYLLLDPFTNGFSKGKPLPPPTPDLRELPTCPVCLERMDSDITGLATILCEHTFHCHCLSKWAGGNCPVCRYSGRKSSVGGSSSTSTSTTTGACTRCGGTENTWICLICGNIGCGRYALGHAHSHFDETGHGYAMEMSTQRVWDYVSDGYVHRLIQSDVGKLVELDESSSSSNGKFVYSDDGKKSGHVEQLALEYSALLTSQLDSQREYYEALFADSAKKVEEMRLQVHRERERVRQELEAQKKAASVDSELQSDNERLKKELVKCKSDSDKLSQLSKTFRQSLQDEKAISEAMMAKVKKLQTDKMAKEAQIKDLEEQLRDVMFFLEARDKLKDANEDVKEGTLVMKKKTKKK